MKIAKYIGDLIYDYECVVIPGLGGFISTEVRANVNKVTNQFVPPSKDVHFNVHLKANDGLLINYIARNEGVSFKAAKQKVDKFVHLCHNALNNGKRINFSKIGYIFFDDQQNIVFKQDKTINYNADAFGLSSFVSPSIRRPSSEEKIKDVFTRKTSNEGNQKGNQRKASEIRKDKRVPSEANRVEQMKARKKPSTVLRQLSFVLLILFAYGTYYVINHRHAMMYYWDRHKTVIPLLYHTPNDYLVANAGILPLDKIDINQASWITGLFDLNKKDVDLKPTDNSVIKEIPVVKQKDEAEEVVFDEPEIIQIDNEVVVVNTNITAEPEIESVAVKEKVSSLKSVLQNRYFIIAGSFKSRANAESLVAKLKNQGYDAAVADTNSYGMFRVAYMGFGNMADAENSLIAVRRESNPEAWILKK